MKKDANIREDDWKKHWKAGTYDYLASGYVPGTHEIEKGEVTWHQLSTTASQQSAANDSASQEPREDSAK
jgi:hypothetical protein